MLNAVQARPEFTKNLFHFEVIYIKIYCITLFQQKVDCLKGSYTQKNVKHGFMTHNGNHWVWGLRFSAMTSLSSSSLDDPTPLSAAEPPKKTYEPREKEG